MGSDELTPSRGAPCQYLRESGLNERSQDEFSWLRAALMRDERLVDDASPWARRSSQPPPF
jgi:hypothetical protein